jgi:hypothetical protein
MTLTKSLPRIEEHRVTVQFECPHCGNQSSGTAYDLRETIRVSTRVPRWGWQSHWVRCGKCKSELHADCSAADLVGASPTIVNGHVRAYVSFPKRVLATASLLLCWAPVLGVLVALVATVANMGTRGWPRWVSLGSLVLSAGINTALFATLVYQDTQVLEPIAMTRASSPA